MRRKIKGNIKRHDYARAVLTDTLPAEVPIIFSNDGFYKNINSYLLKNDFLGKLFRKIVIESKKFTIPFEYRIRKNNSSLRCLSLIHPRSQHDMAIFYRDYETLICHYSSKAPFSLRHPIKAGSTYYYKNPLDSVNKYRNTPVLTMKQDKQARNPSSYFAYGGINRLYKFYKSSSFLRLEKKFPYLWCLDVAKCFDSIYTHSILWAVKEKQFSKVNCINKRTFGDEFDTLMQKANYNETKGIIIGPEISRIFAEIIFQKIDTCIIKALEEKNLRHNVDYSIRRYVDDIFIFSRHEQNLGIISDVISIELGKFKLHVNESKIEKFSRPILTKHSSAIAQISNVLDEFISSFISSSQSTRKFFYPKFIYERNNLTTNFINSIKAACHETGVDYSIISGYLISSLCYKVEKLIEDYDDAQEQEDFLASAYLPAISALIESTFFFYTVSPSVTCSYKLGKIIILSSRFIKHHYSADSHCLMQEIMHHVLDYITNHQSIPEKKDNPSVPLELINVLLATSEFDDIYLLDEQTLESLFNLESANYLEIVSCLFYIKNNHKYSTITKMLEDRINDILDDCQEITLRAEHAYIFLDSISCPYLGTVYRRELIRKSREAFQMRPIDNSALDAIVKKFEGNHWFINWKNIDLLNALEKKELSIVY